ncbi:ImmA/IrrE family metallo-endopeptidase [Methanocalculus taiwanensis]|uniref:ImmA/IrrE family metallo-endopeptidase n=2 Tax=Methanocalculus taiwanensis TaxID=106207 RepID=A0ABD4TPU9_9EURY|nr:ImmA/IrrE family metallo-endopeptidase [Methanocalculus taiwanensis]
MVRITNICSNVDFVNIVFRANQENEVLFMTIGERIRVRRKCLGLSLRDLAEKIERSHTTVDKFEKGLLVPDSGVLIRISDVLEMPLAALLRPSRHTHEIPDGQISFRTKKITGKERTRIEAETKDWLERYLSIEELSGIRRRFEMPAGFPREVSSYDEVETAADDLRKVWDLGTHPIDNLTSLLEDKGLKIGIIRGITKFDALYTRFGDDLVILMRAGLSYARQRFTLAHELGHCLLIPVDGMDHEKVMHRFAGAFLVPSTRVFFELGESRRHISVHELTIVKEKYGLSMSAWIYRASDLGIISADTHTRMRKEFSTLGWNRKEPGDEKAGDDPVSFESLVYRSHAEGIISTSKAAELLNQPIAEFFILNGEISRDNSSLVCH